MKFIILNQIWLFSRRFLMNLFFEIQNEHKLCRELELVALGSNGSSKYAQSFYERLTLPNDKSKK